jgi:hypothetical protein
MKKRVKRYRAALGDNGEVLEARQAEARRTARRQARTVSELSQRRYSKPPQDSLDRLIAAASRDLKTARLTLGLIHSITRREMEALFPGYSWRVSDVLEFGPALIADARRILRWALGSANLILNDLIQGEGQICEAVYSIRARSPIGRKFRRQAASFQRAYPPLPQADWIHSLPGKAIQAINLLPDQIGRPLSDRTIALVRAVHLGRLQVLGDSDSTSGKWTPGVASIRLAPDHYSIKSITLGIALEARKRPKPVRRFEGKLKGFYETGCEGLVWSLYDERYSGYDGFEWIEAGDHLTIMDQLGEVIWRGVIKCDRKTGWQRYPWNPSRGQQCALGYWVHWIQQGFTPDDWARFFIRPSFDRLHGVLLRKRATLRRARERKNREVAAEIITPHPGLAGSVNQDPKGEHSEK